MIENNQGSITSDDNVCIRSRCHFTMTVITFYLCAIVLRKHDNYRKDTRRIRPAYMQN
ncbi:hypothetical protein BDV34DRAFT_186220 [Aspergillus parasiticus]|uniref:Uncharacterized protein n=1 Tax=Aspergillus parasiticus TaxID=5067 RepID=A0A5N6DZI5_ASPPA|nr:hypothetical protein BDV34DRAFT_186220 [Aspergillus parasiticus]